MNPNKEETTDSRKILHIDLDAFFCAVEEQLDPSLIGLPIAVGGSPEGRGVVASCSYAARLWGVRSAMPMARAIRLCPDLKIVRSHYSAYSRASNEVMVRLEKFSTDIEKISIDEAFLDVSHLPESSHELAVRIQAIIRDELDLPCSIGAASNKLVAKIATDVGKSSVLSSRKQAKASDHWSADDIIGPPNAITIVPPGEESAFLAPLPVRALWGVGPKTADKLARLGINTIGELANYPDNELERLFGKHGFDLARRAKGIDDRPVTTHFDPKSFSHETTFAVDEHDGEVLQNVLFDMSGKLSKRLSKAQLLCNTVKIKIRWPSFETITRQRTLPNATDSSELIYRSAIDLFRKEWEKNQPVRLIGLGVSGLAPPVRQLTFWDEDLLKNSVQTATKDKPETNSQLQTALEELRKRYGANILFQASKLKKDKD